MDEKLISVLTSISENIEVLATTIKDSNKNKEEDKYSAAFNTANIDKQLEVLAESIKEVKKDTNEILKGQRQLVQMAEQRQTQNMNGFDFSSSESLKKGIGIIALMAGSILALGVAFKVVGEVDFTSVIALSIAMPLVATAFAKIATIQGITYDTIKIVGLSVLAMSVAIAGSSLILSKVSTVSPIQLLTIVGIAAAFNAISYGLSDIANAASKISIKGLALMPLVLVTTSLAITASSYVLGATKPVGLLQLISAIGIAAVFTVVSFGLPKISKNMESVNPLALLSLPLVMYAMSWAIAESSSVLNRVTPFTGGVAGFLTIVGIAATFVMFGYALKPLSKALEGAKVQNLLLMPVVMLGMSAAVVASSHLLQYTAIIEPGKLWNVILISGALSLSTILLSPALYLIDKIGVGPVLKGALVLPILAGSMMVSSHLLSLGDYSNYPTLDWAIGVGASMGAYGLGAIVLGGIISTGAGAIAMGLGAIAMPILSASIVATSQVLSSGTYNSGPDISWALSTSLLLVTFGTAMVTLGAFIGGTLGLGALALKVGSNAVLNVAETIVSASEILNKGTYSGGPTKEWAEGVALSLGAFSPVYAMLIANNIMKILTFGTGGVSVNDFNEAIKLISGGIIYAGNIFANSPSIWSNGPSKEWAEGVGKSIAAFSPVYAMLMSDNILSLFGLGVNVNDFNTAIEIISGGIIKAGEIFAKGSGIWGLGPSKEWADGVATSIGAFANIYDMGSGIFGLSPNEMLEYNMVIAGHPYSIANTMTNLAISLRDASNVSIGNLDTFYGNINKYFTIVDKIKEYDTFFGESPVLKTARMFSTLSKSINDLGKSINSLDLKKLETFQLFTGITVDLLKMDHTKYASTMEAFEKRTDAIRSVYDNMESQISSSALETKGIFATIWDKITSIATGGNDSNLQIRTINDLYDVLSDIQNMLNSEKDYRLGAYEGIDVIAQEAEKKLLK